ncbi:conserved oligomeric Golgi complex subunit 3 isoform X2 [Panthera pardus]|uniref:Conserved oligomeric Golgi complex subunit 3 n=1 Tax=Panthera pardus TaxID=9691 RepID=A0A9V1FHQ9_PANPR|nr:conserved oligomeric Golgi complex subunit 3 isoform X2 [Panthera pardus]XP_060493132.1 conserved oligomeric Golgi complex subunit 3 isoform X2 [Panthera onca]
MAEAALLLPPEAAAERDAREKLALWDRRPDTTAPLTDRQTDSVLELKAAVENLPVPAELPLEDLCSLTSQSLPAAEPSIVPESTEDILLKGFISLEMEEERIETAQQFFSWFAKLQTQMDQDEETKYRQMRDYLSGFQEQCDAILNDVNSALQHLESLQKQYLFVSNKTGTLHEACEQLLKEQSELVDLAENIQQKLSYFNELETINTKLNSPTLSVNSEGFIPMLAKLDDCITYISSHPHFKDYPVYLLKFKQCLSKALHLMKTYTVNTLQNLTSQLLKRDPASVPNADNAFTLFYVKFRAAAPKVRTIIEQIEQRSEKIPEYQQLLNDIHQCYLDQRELLLGPSITCTVTELTSQNNRDHCALIRSGCAFMVHVCQDEHQLYNEFFTKPTSKLDELLEKLCVSLYDVFRPLIIHVIHLETLSELCGILKNEVLEDHVQNNAEQLGAFAAGVKQMLEDVQERLVYRTHIYIQTDITGYKPAPGDLAYPDKLVMMEQIAQSLKDEQKKVPSEASFSDVQLEETESNNLTKSGSTESLNPRPQTTISPADLHGMWYPTVRRTLVCLSKLYRCIDRAVFQGLSQEALSACIQSLVGASESISKNKIAPFHTEFTIKEISLDLKKTRDAAFKILNPMTVPRFFRLNSNNALIEFLLEGTPEIREHYLDSKKDVDRHLKSACEQFIQQQTKQFVEQLEEFMTKVSALKTMASQGGPKYTLSQQPWAQPAKVCELVASAYKTIKAKLPLTLRSMSLYLSNKDTEFILFKPVRNNIQQVFQKFHVLLKEDFSPEDTQIIACPSMEQLNLLLSVSK